MIYTGKHWEDESRNKFVPKSPYNNTPCYTGTFKAEVIWPVWQERGQKNATGSWAGLEEQGIPCLWNLTYSYVTLLVSDPYQCNHCK